jgi:hypothetical protein
MASPNTLHTQIKACCQLPIANVMCEIIGLPELKIQKIWLHVFIHTLIHTTSLYALKHCGECECTICTLPDLYSQNVLATSYWLYLILVATGPS